MLLRIYEHSHVNSLLSGPNATRLLSQYAVALQAVALRLRSVTRGYEVFCGGMLHLKLPLGGCRSTGGCCKCTVACRAAVGHLGCLGCSVGDVDEKDIMMTYIYMIYTGAFGSPTPISRMAMV